MTILAFIADLGAWAWFAFAALLLILELFAPGAFFLWFGIAAAAVGLLTGMLGLPWQAQWVAFGILSVAFIIVYRRYFRNRTEKSDTPFLNQRSLAAVGKIAVLIEPISQGRGRIRLGDTIWQVEGPDLPENTAVRIVSADGALLYVEELGQSAD